MKIYCPFCHKETEYYVEKRKVNKFKGINVSTYENVGVCLNCKNDLYIPELEDENIERINKVYRKNIDLVSPAEIKKFRNNYNLSQRELSAILNYSKMTINRYENGELPTKAQSDYLKIIMNNPREFENVAKKSYENNRITLKTFLKVIGADTEFNPVIKELENIEETSAINSFTGLKKFYYENTENLISYISSKINKINQEMLTYYLWFIDVSTFARDTTAITGLTYYKINDSIKSNNVLDKLLQLKNKYELVNSNIISKNNYNMSCFRVYEQMIIDYVLEFLKNKNIEEIKEAIASEKCFKDNEENEKFNFKFVHNLVCFDVYKINLKRANYSAEIIAKWFIEYDRKNRFNEGEGITNLKLEKLLYYAQGYYLAKKNAPLFDDKIIAWDHGPVVNDVYQKYKKFGSSKIEIEDNKIYEAKIDKDTEQILIKVYEKYAQYSAWKLSDMTHQEEPWKLTKKNEEITKELMGDYFRRKIISIH